MQNFENNDSLLHEDFMRDFCAYFSRHSDYYCFDWEALRKEFGEYANEANNRAHGVEDTSTWNWFAGVRRDAGLEPAPVVRIRGRQKSRIARQYAYPKFTKS